MLTSPTLTVVPDRSSHRGWYDPRSVLSRPADGPDVVLRWSPGWANHPDGVADVFLPPTPPSCGSAPGPLLYALHGGFWRQDFDRRHLRPLAHALCADGWVVVLPEYTRSGGRRAESGDRVDAPWPLIVDDLRTVRRRVPRLLAEVVPGRVATGPPVLLGHSAGGQLALWWALDASGEPDHRQRARHVLALAPVADLERAAREHIGADAVQALLGGPPSGPAASGAGADPAARLRADGTPDGCALVVLHGEDDLQVPVAHSRALGDDVPALDVRPLPGVEHFALVDPLSPAWPAVLAALPERAGRA